MIVNTLMLKLKNRDKQSISEVKKELLSMEGNVDVLDDLKVELNIHDGKLNFDLLFITFFESMKDFEAYLIDPFHLNVIKNNSDSIAESSAVCFETTKTFL